MSHDDLDLAGKIQWLIDIEEIKQLKARYAAACDNNYEPDTIAGLFTEDAIWDGGMMGFAKTRSGIREFFSNASSLVGFAVHGLSNPIINVDGDTATGQWYLHQPMTMKGSNSAYWFCARYEDQYVRTSDGWKFQHVKITERAFSPYEDGFGKVLMADLPT
jgi:ketosteroid isomerase-like protein